MTGNWDQVADAISRATGTPFRPKDATPVSGGCINAAVRLADGDRSYFVKTNAASAIGMFEAERDGLRAMAVPLGPKVPAPVAVGIAGRVAFLVLEYVPLTRMTGSAWTRLGQQLAALHRTTSEAFGWHRDNAIGSTPQINAWTPRWVEFWRDHRLGYQLALAEQNGLHPSIAARGRNLVTRLGRLFDDHEPQPSLLHGDLWSGNVAADPGGKPVLFDPAVYYGDREADIAMSELFGRFDRRFYDAYREAWPLEPGYERRKTLYNLYHMLNHFNLFGGGYAGQVKEMIDELLDVLQAGDRPVG